MLTFVYTLFLINCTYTPHGTCLCVDTQHAFVSETECNVLKLTGSIFGVLTHIQPTLDIFLTGYSYNHCKYSIQSVSFKGAA